MKFGKSIVNEARNNRGLAFINYKYLKRILKKCGAAVASTAQVASKAGDEQFYAELDTELRKVGESYWNEIQQISNLQTHLTETFAVLNIQPDPKVYCRMGLEQLQAHLRTICGLEDDERSEDLSSPSKGKSSAALYDFCLNLVKVSSRCKRLRCCVLWNAVAVVKILKKRQKHRVVSASCACQVEGRVRYKTAAEILSRQDWYCCDQLPTIVSIVETTTNELMQRLTLMPPSRDEYQCPICLDVVVDPVCLRTCGHRFCWACLCMAYCEKPEGTLERCPCCRAAFPLDPEAFELDGILGRFLRNFFPEDQVAREKEQKENLRQHLHQRRQREGRLGQDGLLKEARSSRNRDDDVPKLEVDKAGANLIIPRLPIRPPTEAALREQAMLDGPLVHSSALSGSSSFLEQQKQHLFGNQELLRVRKPSSDQASKFDQASSPRELSPCSARASTASTMAHLSPRSSLRPSRLSMSSLLSFQSSIACLDTGTVDSVVAALLCETPRQNAPCATPLLENIRMLESDALEEDFIRDDDKLLPALRLDPRPAFWISSSLSANYCCEIPEIARFYYEAIDDEDDYDDRAWLSASATTTDQH